MFVYTGTLLSTHYSKNLP